MYGGEEKNIQDSNGDLRERDHLEGLGFIGRIILKWVFKKWGGITECIDLAKDRAVGGLS